MSIDLSLKLDVYLANGRGALLRKHCCDYEEKSGRKYESGSLREIVIPVRNVEKNRDALSPIILSRLDTVLVMMKTI
ncbi:MAG: hypothetical protein MUP81_01520 [Dehalococcoidia bacterium]|nr:hypothetical protein [Dehalococcoidia bacterium]